MKYMRVYPKLEVNPVSNNTTAYIEPVDIPAWVYRDIVIKAQMAVIKRLYIGYQGAFPSLDRTLSAMMRELYNERPIE